jgi:uncharacterized protein with ParB-like and HNH nuclease domain
MKTFEPELSLKDLFTEKLFRIPDFQRGYSWEEKHLDDLWEDIENLYEGGEHYTGLITVKDSSSPGTSWLGFNTLEIIDGQQRLTTLVILLNELIEKAESLKMSELDNLPIPDIKQKYLYRSHINNPSLKVSILSYSVDDPSDEFLKCKILKIKDQPKENVITAYTKRMENARNYFREKLNLLEGNRINQLFAIVAKKLVFNLYKVSGDKDASMIFESLNNRGKKLSTLELLKNRLIYLTEKLKVDEEARKGLRDKIKKSWKIIYEWLGKDELMDDEQGDDQFLKNHWIMYYEYSRKESNVYADRLLKQEFSLKKAYEKDQNMIYDKISDYIVSLSDSVKHWYFMHYPEKAVKYYNEEIINEIARLNRISYTPFMPLVMGVLLDTDGKRNIDLVVNMFKTAEEYIFKVFALTGKQSNTGDSVLYRLSKAYFDKEVDIQNAIDKIQELTNKHFKIQGFSEMINNLYEDYEGFYYWNYINYFLFEYDLWLRENSRGTSGKSIEWENYSKYKKDYVSVEHIYPQNDGEQCWKTTFQKFSADEKEVLRNSLGNLLPLSVPRNSSFQNHCFEKKKDDGNGGGYCVGSHSEAEVYKQNKWDAENILERGTKMLEFMESRWSIQIADKKSLLGLDFL